MIYVVLRGGLGNQMFQYAAGRALSLKHGEPLGLAVAGYKRDKKRRFALGDYSIAAEIFPNLPIEKSRSILRRFWQGKKENEVPCITEPAFQYWPEFLNLPPHVIIDGYWQSERYFSAYAEVIRQDFRLKSALTHGRQSLLRQIESSPSVSVHVRRGDYVSDPLVTAVHGVVGVEWYARAMQKMLARVKDAKFFVFSDDIEWARLHLPVHGEMEFVPNQNDGLDMQDMHLMSRCQNHIIANSSFSWWSAWLNSAIQKTVIAPHPWFASPEFDTRDLLPPDWTRMEA